MKGGRLNVAGLPFMILPVISQNRQNGNFVGMKGNQRFGRFLRGLAPPGGVTGGGIGWFRQYRGKYTKTLDGTVTICYNPYRFTHTTPQGVQKRRHIMNLWEQGRTGLLANHPNWGKFVGGVTLVTSGRMLTTFYTVGLTFHVTDTNIEVSTDNPPLFQSADDFLRTLDAMKMFYRLGKANKDDVERAARAYQAKVWSDCDRIGRKRPAMKLSNLVVVR